MQRWKGERNTTRAGKEREANQARETIELLGGGELKILHFYAAPAVIERGAQASMCFGAFGAKRVRVEPRAAKLHPAVSYCFPVSPDFSTEYTLTAEDGTGKSVSKKVVLRVIR